MPRRFSLDDLVALSRAPATHRAYARDWASFTAWCTHHGRDALPASAETVALYLADHADRLRPVTLEGRLSGIAHYHQRAGLAFDRAAPLIATAMAGLRRAVGSAPVRQKEALLGEEVRAIVAALPDTLAGRRDRALILLAFATASRRSELAALGVDDLNWTSEGVVVRIRQRKDDPGGRGAYKGVPFGAHPGTCPVGALKKWIMAAGLEAGEPLFRPVDRHGNLLKGGLSGHSVAQVIKRAVAAQARAGGATRRQAAQLAAAVGGHSLRAGAITTAARAGASDWDILAMSLQSSPRSLKPYVRRAGLFENAAQKLGL